MYEVVGLQRRKGEYQGNKYDNMMVHCIRPGDAANEEEGNITEIFKIKMEAFDADVQVGSKIDPRYDLMPCVISLVHLIFMLDLKIRLIIHGIMAQ